MFSGNQQIDKCFEVLECTTQSIKFDRHNHEHLLSYYLVVISQAFLENAVDENAGQRAAIKPGSKRW